MHPSLYEPLHLQWYPALLLLGYFAGWLIMRIRAKNAGIDPRHADNLVLLILISGLVGARLAARLFYAPHISFIDSFAVWRGGGMVFYGGFIGGALTALIYARVKKLPIAKFLDVCAPGVAAGLALGRVGCFMVGCCFGDICALPANHSLDPQTAYQVRTLPILSPEFLGVQFPKKSDAFKQHEKLGLLEPTSVRSLPVHAVQLYEAFIAGALALWLCRRKPLFAGEIAIRLLVGYSIARFALEFLRGDNQPLYLGMTISQVISLLLLAIAIWFAARRTHFQGAAAVRIALRRFNTLFGSRPS
jgi:phosphatidylglycerol---prolipoprotein diacylglyceryl transferase